VDERHELALACSESVDPRAVRRERTETDEADRDEPEPPRLIEVGLEMEYVLRAEVVPDAVVVARDDPKRVRPVRNVRVVRGATRARFDPRAIPAFELVLEADPFGDAEAERGVVELEALRTR